MAQEFQHLKVVLHDPSTGEDKPMAEFRMRDGKLQARWHDARYRASLHDEGIRLGRKTYRPEDGEDFLKALAASAGSSSYLLVENVDAA